ncbi:MAG TPA: hydantoinase B/oxoprolinase family protein [Stellaceae bacterium]|jgi:N-methylhydantoinase B|nr:hydantoinase B/oxoprolinase family protein [Stellaceae bacterium]
MLSRPNAALSQIHMQIMWSRLIAVVEEQAQTLVRTAFSTPVREAGDLSAGVFDRDGNMLAQAVTGTPGHVNSMAAAVKHFLNAFPLNTMKPGDHYITNDPWLTCGHLHDLTVVSPTFLRGEPVGMFASTVHVVDIGGLGMGPDGRQVFEEGLAIPLMALAREGRMNEDLMGIIRANVREPLQVEGDVYALAACNDEGSKRLVEMMDEFGIANLDRLGDHIVETSRQATLDAIRKLTPGKYKYSVGMDGYDRPLTLAGEMTIADSGIHVDYAGTSPASSFGINVVMNYTLAYTAFGVKCLVAPEVPNNAGSLAPITASAPDGCLLNVKRPRAVAARHTVGHMLPDVVFGCLHQVMEGGVPAEGASSLWNPQIYGGADVADELGDDGHAEVPPFSTVIFHCGGTGARPGKDGLDVTAFPSGVRTIPVEATESVAPVMFRRREFREGSGGAGQYRGGLGQIIELGGAEGMPVAMLCNFERINNPARGRDGGGRGAPGKVTLVSGKPIRSKGRQTVQGGDFIRLELPGGGGFGNPATRDADQVASDVADGLITREMAETDYRVALGADGTVDRAMTAQLRLAAAE